MMTTTTKKATRNTDPKNRRQILSAAALIGLGAMTGMQRAHAAPVDDFFTAIIRDNPSSIKSMLQRGFDPNTRNSAGDPPLIFALQKESMRAFAALLESKKINVELRNKKDESALMIAAIKGNLEQAKVLIDRDADVNKTGWTPLHYAASCATDQAVPMIQLLLENFAYIDAASPNGTTPLMMAVRYGTADAARLLISEGADPSIRNEKGLTAVEFAAQADRNDMAQAVTEAIRKRRVQPGAVAAPVPGGGAAQPQPSRGSW